MCFCYEVFLPYIINYAVECDHQLFSIIKTGLTHTFLLVVPGPNQNPAPFVVLNKHKNKPPYFVAKMYCHATCSILCGFFRISSYLIGNISDADLYLQFNRLPHKEHNNLLSTAAGVVGPSHRGMTDTPWAFSFPLHLKFHLVPGSTAIAVVRC